MMPARNPSVLFVDQSADIGGAELSLLDIVRRRKGVHRICVLAEGDFAARLRQLEQPVFVIEAGGTQGIRRDQGIREILGSIPDLGRLLRRFSEEARNHDLVYANTMKAFVVASLSRPLHRKPVVWHLRDLLTAEHFSAVLRHGSALLSRGRSTRVIANSEATAQAYRRAGGGAHVEVVYNGLDPAPFDAVDAAAARSRLVAETGLDADRPIVGVFSRLARWKGQHILVEALKSLPDFQAVIVGGALFGEGAYEEELRAAIAADGLHERVRLLGFRRDVPALMKAVDMVAHTSIASEPFGRVIVEGMLARKPVIATRAGGALELVQHGETGLLVEPGDASALAATLQSLHHDPVRGAGIVARADASARQFFHVEKYVDKIEEIIGCVVSKSRA